jgi:lysophospholipase L1-like esterase
MVLIMAELTNKSLAEIEADIATHKQLLDEIQATRQEVRGYNTVPLTDRGATAAPLRAMLAAKPAKRTFNLLAQGDSWFDYPPGTDIIDCLHSNHGHTITNIAVAGSTLNDEAYGPVPREMFGFGPPQSNDPDRITELVHQIHQVKPQALLISAGGNDVAGDEFFSFINNARSGLLPVNGEVLDGVVNGTFKTAYQYLIDTALNAAESDNIKMPVFTHSYDYPWPDGRPAIVFLWWRIGPWFDQTFNAKNYPNVSAATLQTRHDILVKFIDAVNSMLKAVAADPKYSGKVFHVDLRRTLLGDAEWANELHPRNPGFSKLADKIDAALQANI